MKKLILILIFLISVVCANAQKFNRSIVIRSIKSDTTTHTPLMMRSTFNSTISPTPFDFYFHSLTPIIFTAINLSPDGRVTLGNNFGIGLYQIYGFANGKFESDTSLTILSQKFFVGGGVNYGVIINENKTLTGTLPIGVILGLKYVSFFAGYDVINKSNVVGVSIAFIGTAILPSLSKVNLPHN